jgi:large subunit ribosomal protein L15
VGRGRGSRRGKTATRGTKGQKARTGHHGARIGFEGGQMPMQRRLPKRGFVNPFRVAAHPVNVADLAKRFDQGVVGVEEMKAAGLVPRRAMVVKVLGEGEMTKKLTVRAHGFSKRAMEKIQAAGGQAETLAAPAAEIAAPA